MAGDGFITREAGFARRVGSPPSAKRWGGVRGGGESGLRAIIVPPPRRAACCAPTLPTKGREGKQARVRLECARLIAISDWTRLPPRLASGSPKPPKDRENGKARGSAAPPPDHVGARAHRAERGRPDRRRGVRRGLRGRLGARRPVPSRRNRRLRAAIDFLCDRALHHGELHSRRPQGRAVHRLSARSPTLLPPERPTGGRMSQSTSICIGAGQTACTACLNRLSA